MSVVSVSLLAESVGSTVLAFVLFNEVATVASGLPVLVSVVVMSWA